MKKIVASFAFAAGLALAAPSNAVTVVVASGNLDDFTVAIDNAARTITITEVWGPMTSRNVRLLIDELPRFQAWTVTKIVTNNTDQEWIRFDHELLNGDGSGSNNTDGLSFSQNVPRPRASDLLPTIFVDELEERDYLSFSGGVVGFGETVTFTYGLRDSRDNSPFFLSQTANIPEPATWALLIAGFGMVGFASRRRSRSVTA